MIFQYLYESILTVKSEMLVPLKSEAMINEFLKKKFSVYVRIIRTVVQICDSRRKLFLSLFNYLHCYMHHFIVYLYDDARYYFGQKLNLL